MEKQDGEEVVVVKETRSVKRHSDTLSRNINRFQDINAALKGTRAILAQPVA